MSYKEEMLLLVLKKIMFEINGKIINKLEKVVMVNQYDFFSDKSNTIFNNNITTLSPFFDVTDCNLFTFLQKSHDVTIVKN